VLSKVIDRLIWPLAGALKLIVIEPFPSLAIYYTPVNAVPAVKPNGFELKSSVPVMLPAPSAVNAKVSV
jgi:hypothetical protein